MRRAGLVTLLLLVVSPPTTAQRALVIERFDAAIRVLPDGTIDVTETITARFSGSWNGLFRTIPVKYHTPQGFSWTLGLDLGPVTDADGQPLRIEKSRERHYLKVKIWVPGAVDATRTVVLRYRARNALRFFEQHDELYWNVTGDEWDVPIEAAEARIELPAAAQGVRAIAFNGAYGSTAQESRVEVGGTSIRITMPHRLEFHEGLTAVVGWNKGVVAEPTAADRASGFLRSNWPLLIPIPVFFGMLALWRRRGRDPARRPITVQYEPPDGLTPAEAGALLDNAADLRDVTATLVDLAVRGHLTIEEREERKLFGLIGERDYIFHRRSKDGPLQPHEHVLLQGIFEGRGESVELSELEDEFYQELPGIRKGIFERLLDRGFYRARPDAVKGRWVFLALASGAILAGAGGALSGRFSMTPVPFIGAGVLVGLILLGFGLVMPARTEAGARALERVLGFEEFLRRVESEHYAHVVKTPELFDRFLPYAMAFGVEKKWARAFQDIYAESPTWYVGAAPGRFDFGGFSSRLNDLSTRAGSTMSSSPRSSGGSGFGGGGSSGGGGGGGGGGGF